MILHANKVCPVAKELLYSYKKVSDLALEAGIQTPIADPQRWRVLLQIDQDTASGFDWAPYLSFLLTVFVHEDSIRDGSFRMCWTSTDWMN